MFLMRCAPKSAEISDAGTAPDLLGVGLEEVPVEPPSVVAGDVALEVGLVLRRPDAHPRVRRRATHRLDEPEAAQRVERLDRIVDELALVVDVAHPRAAQELVGAEDLEPEIVDRLHLGEEAMTADVEAPAVALDGAADPADDRVGFEDRARVTRFRELVRGGEAGRTRSDDDHAVDVGRSLRRRDRRSCTAFAVGSEGKISGPITPYRRPSVW